MGIEKVTLKVRLYKENLPSRQKQQTKEGNKKKES